MNRKEHWESVYQDRAYSEVSWYQKEPALSCALIKKYSPDHTAQIIDIGGGASTLVDHLLAAGFVNLTVLDVSANARLSTRQRLGDEAAGLVAWEVADITDFIPSRTYDLWHDRAVFHFLTESYDREKYRQVLAASVRAGGHLIIAAFALDGPTQCSGLTIVQYDAKTLGVELGEDFLLVEEQAEQHITPSGKAQSFGYYVFTKKA